LRKYFKLRQEPQIGSWRPPKYITYYPPKKKRIVDILWNSHVKYFAICFLLVSAKTDGGLKEKNKSKIPSIMNKYMRAWTQACSKQKQKYYNSCWRGNACLFVFFFWFREFKKIRRIIRRGMETAKKNITKKKKGCALIVRNTLFFYK
jgi:hypothetical protein